MTPRLPRIGITGGIGSGKSYLCRALEEEAETAVFYCDLEAHRLMHLDADLRRELTELVGEEVYDSDGRIVKPVLSAFIRSSEAAAAQVNARVHPRVRDSFILWCQVHDNLPPSLRPSFLLMECALLFEAGFEKLVDSALCVVAPKEERMRRLRSRDGIGTETAEAWMRLQLPQEEKARRADIVVPNDGTAPLPIAEIIQRLSTTPLRPETEVHLLTSQDNIKLFNNHNK